MNFIGLYSIYDCCVKLRLIYNKLLLLTIIIYFFRGEPAAT